MKLQDSELLKQKFRQEFLNRLDDIIVEQLNKNNLKMIVKLILKQLRERVADVNSQEIKSFFTKRAVADGTKFSRMGLVFGSVWRLDSCIFLISAHLLKNIDC